MKKLFIFLACLLCASSYSMETDLSQAQIKEEAAKTAARFGGFDYLEHAIKEHGGPAVMELEKVKNVMTDPSYVFVFRNEDKSISYRLGLFLGLYKNKYCFELYKEVMAERLYLKIGVAICYLKSGRSGDYYYLDHLELIPLEQHHGKGAALFLYMLHALRQLMLDVPLIMVQWTAASPCASSGPDQEALNRFYERMGGKKLVCCGSFGCDFEWQGSSLVPFCCVEKGKKN